MKNIELNPSIGNIDAYQLAIGNENCFISMIRSSDINSGAATCVNLKIDDIREGKTNAEDIKVEMVSLDSFIRRLALPELNFIKIDVEGFESLVVAGAIETIKLYRPRIVFELDDSNLKRAGSSAVELCCLVRELGYHLINAESGVPIDFDDISKHIDVLAKRWTGFVRQRAGKDN